MTINLAFNESVTIRATDYAGFTREVTVTIDCTTFTKLIVTVEDENEVRHEFIEQENGVGGTNITATKH